VSGLRGATDIGPYLVSTRSAAEYRAMFALTDDDLRGGSSTAPAEARRSPRPPGPAAPRR
jgi:hypothetical protein